MYDLKYASRNPFKCGGLVDEVLGSRAHFDKLERHLDQQHTHIRDSRLRQLNRISIISQLANNNATRDTMMNAATQVFNLPELVELILLSLPCDTIYSQIGSMRTIHIARTTALTWHLLMEQSTPLRKSLYLPSCVDETDTMIWTQRTPFPPAEPNPWIPHLLLNQRSWGQCVAVRNKRCCCVLRHLTISTTVLDVLA